MGEGLNKGNRWKEKNKIFSNPSESNAYKAYNYFIDKGLTPEQASGIVGNLAQESSIHLKTGIEEVTDRKDKGYGIAQWTFGRRTALEKYAKEVEKPVNDINVQLDFLWQELNTTEKKAFNALKNAQSPEQAAEIFHDKFERSADKKGDKNYNRRINYANQFHSEFSGISSTTPQSDFNSPMGGQVDEEEFMKAFERANQLQQQEELRQQQAIAESEYKTQLQNKLNQRNFLLELANDYEVPVVEYNKEAKMEGGGTIPVSTRGVYDYPNQKVLVPTDGNITMKDVNHPILGISLDTGQKQMMFPDQDYFFENTKNVLEIPQIR